MFDYQLFNDVSCIYNYDIIIYGIGEYGKKVYDLLNKLNIVPCAVCTTDGSNELFAGRYHVETLDAVGQKYDRQEVMIIIASKVWYSDMKAELEKRNISKVAVCTIYALFGSILLHRKEKWLCNTLANEIDDALNLWNTRCMLNRKMLEVEVLYELAQDVEQRVWIYQAGKVGSKSIASGLRDKAVHFHSLQLAYYPYYFDDMPTKKLVDRYIEKITKKDKIRIITGVREPIARDISVLFQPTDFSWKGPLRYITNVPFYTYGDYASEETEKRPIITPKWENSLTDTFLDAQKIMVSKKTDEFSWFDYEIKGLFGIDIYEYPFDKEKGYQIIKKDNIEIFLYKCEKLNELEKELGNFVGDKQYKLGNENINEQKIYQYTYAEFKENVVLDKDYFDYYYKGNKKVLHFYSKKEIEEFSNRWTSKIKQE